MSKVKKGVYDFLRGSFLTDESAFKNWRIIIFVVALMLIMISSAHSADKKVHEIAKLSNEVKELRSAFVDGRSKLMRLKMESSIINKVAEKGIQISEIPPTKIKVKSQSRD